MLLLVLAAVAMITQGGWWTVAGILLLIGVGIYWYKKGK